MAAKDKKLGLDFNSMIQWKKNRNCSLRNRPHCSRLCPIWKQTYDTIILIYPLWWGTVPRAVESALQPYDLTGKRIIPIVTHGSSGDGDSIAALGRMTTAKVGPDCLTVYSSDVPRIRQKIVEFLKKESKQ